VPGREVAHLPGPLTDTDTDNQNEAAMNTISTRTLLRLLMVAGLAAVALVAVPSGPAGAAGVPCQRTFTSTTDVAIPQGPVISAERIDVPEDGLVVADVDATMNIDHAASGDLAIRLAWDLDDNSEDLSERILLLVNQEGGGTGVFRDTTFDDAATTSITEADPPFTGRFRPENPLAELNGVTGGRYKLLLQDVNRPDIAGTLTDWSVTLTYQRCDFDADGVEDHVDSCLGLVGRTASGCPVAARKVTASHRGGKVTGRLSSPVAACKAGRDVAVWKVRRGPDRKVRTTRTRVDGSFRLARVKPAGRYYATAPRVVVPDAAECRAVKSRAFRGR
jgi:hypothetical protein